MTALAALEVVLLLARPSAPGALVLVLLMFPAVALTYLAAGVVAWSRRPGNRLGALMVAGALAWIAAGLLNVAVPAVAAVGLILATLPLAVVLHLLLSFPSGRLHSRAERATVATVYVAALVLQAPSYLFGQGPAGPSPALLVADRPDLAEIGHWVQDAVAGLAAASAVVLLLRRHRAATATQRAVLGPLYVYGILVWLFVPVSARVLPSLAGPVATAVAQLVVVGALPVVFALAVRRGGFARTGDLDEVSAWLAVRSGGGAGLTRALGEALGDPSVRLRLGDADAGGGAAAVPVELAGRRVGSIAYDATLLGDAEPVRAAARMVAVALDHERLTGELSASRARIAHAADEERRRIAHDLHDGLQGRLVVLGMEASLLSTGPALPADARAAAASLRDGLEAGVRDLRAIVQGLLPAALVERGLPAALDDLADRMPVRPSLTVDVDAATARPSPAAELTAYYVVAEALANAAKHAGAGSLAIRLRQRDGWLTVDVADDGAGGAAPAGGLGLRGMADRVDVLGGRLRIDSPPGGGTRVTAEIPCGS